MSHRVYDHSGGSARWGTLFRLSPMVGEDVRPQPPTRRSYPYPAMPDAACIDDHLYDSDRPADVAEQKRWCKTQCPEIGKCLDYALHVGVDGVWGGTDAQQRGRMRKQAGIVAEPVVTAADLMPVQLYRYGVNDLGVSA